MDRLCTHKDGTFISSQSGGRVEVTAKMAEDELREEGVKDITEDDVLARYGYLRDQADILEEMRLDTLKQNAINSGYAEEDIIVSWVLPEEIGRAIQNSQPEKTVSELREDEYLKEGLTTDELIVALWEKLVEGRSEAADTIQGAREIIKLKYPKT